MDPQDRITITGNIDYFVEKTKDFEIVLEKLFEKNVFTDKMRQLIRAENTEDDKTRRMYTMIPKRGPLAFKHLYDTFMECGLCDMAMRLNPKMSVRCGCVEQSSLVTVTPASKRMDINDKVYQMGSRPKGYMLLIIIESSTLFETWNSKQDETLLIELWKSLGYKVCLQNKNLSKRELIDALMKFRDMAEHENVDSCVVHILSPADKKANIYEAINICCADGNTISSERIMNFFKPNNCFSLRCKPKLFFFHLYGCQRKNISFDFSASDSNKIEKDISLNEFVPDHADIFYVNSLVVGNLSQSVFIEDMANVFGAEAHNNDLESMISRISSRTESLHFEDLQGPIHISWETRSFKLLFFHPGLYD